ncbi:MAG TPA: hypothetical protein VGZ03_08665 [Acidimicrobiales bacterium]|nr:hypothetical protein [Acidimicrobiales bacterium]
MGCVASRTTGWQGLVRRATGRDGPGRAPDEAGDTLIEVLFAIAILGIASVALLVAFAASISASAVHRSLATFDTVIRSASQQAISQIQQQPNPLYESCAPLAYYQSGPGAVVFNLPSGYSAQVTSVQYWTGSVFSSNISQCVPNSPQWITITITSTTTGQSYTNNFIVDNPYAPPVPVGGPAYQLVFVQQPSGADAGVAFTSQPAVAVEDSSGHVVTTDLSPVTLTITTGTGTGGAVLSQYCTGVENSGVVIFSGCSINLAGLNYQLTASDPGSGGGALVPAISTPFSVYTQLTQPVITSLIPSTTQAGAVNVTFTGSSNAPGGENYTVTACANSGVGFGCVTQNNFTSGSDLTGLTPGTGYYVTVTANAPTPLYLPATSATAGPAQATVQLNAPGTPTLAYGTVAGSLSVTFSTPTPASPTQTYTARACTNAAMTSGCVTGAVTAGGNLTGLAYSAGSAGTTYYVTVSADASPGYLVSAASGVSAPQADVSQLNPPTGFSTASSATTPGAVSVTFAASAGPTVPASYTASICTNAAMTAGCTTQSVSPGTTQLTGLTAGTTYYVQLLANPPSAGFLGASTSVAPGVPATTQLAAPTGVSLAYGTVAGSINVSYTPSSNAAPGQTYTARACTNVGMTTGCVSNASLTSGSNLTGLSFTQGSPGTTYFVTVTANASSGYFVSASTSPLSQVDTSRLNAPGIPTAVASTSTPGAIVITYAAPGGTAPTGYTATACTNSSMTSNCQTAFITSGGTMNGLNQGSSYWVTVTSNPPSGYVGNTSPVSTNPTGASTQLNTPTINAVAPSNSTAGQLTINYTGSSNAPGGQTYTATACTDVAMTLNCVSHASYTSGSQFTGLTPGTLYYVTITAVSSANYLAATTAPVGPTLATVQLATPATPTLGFGSVAGSISVTATTSNGPVGQLYTVKACTNAAMTTGCVTTTNVLSGGNATGLAYTQGSPGSSYYATVTAQSSSGYLGSGTSGVAGPQADTSLLNAPGTPTVAPSSTTAGAITATFTNSSGPTVASYSVNACTNAGMTQNCVTTANYTSGAQFTGLTQGSTYFVTITAVSSSAAYAASTSGASSSVMATVQLSTPTITSVAPSTTTAGQLTIGFSGSANAPGGQSYTAIACTDAGMTQNCVTHLGYASGSQFTGLTAGTSYFVTITAVASTGYLPTTTAAVGPTMATVQLATPTTPTLAYGTVAGSLAITTSSANAPAGQLFTITACTNVSMSSGCVTDTNVLSGGNATGLAFAAGSAGTSYYVTAIAQASSGYLTSGASGVGGPHAATSQLATPTNLVTTPSATTVGAITATFTASSGVAPASYTATVCTNAAMTTGCATYPGDTSGTSLTGLTAGTGYYTTITAVSGSAAYVAATTASSGPTLATSQLVAPTGVSLAYGTVAGSIAVTYTGSSNAPGGQTYTVTACTNAGMTTGCVSNGNLASGANLTGLAYVQGAPGTTYYVTVTANASSGYLASAPSATAGPQNATSQLGTPGTPVVASSTTVAGAITATFAASSGTAPASYTAKACTNAAMTSGCLSQTNYTSGAQIVPLAEGTSYFVTITAIPGSTAFVSATSAVSASSAVASTQLTTPTITGVAPSTTTAGAITIAYTGSANAPGGQIYTATACTDVAMTLNCTAVPGYVSGSQLTGLGAGTAYYVTITAGASNGYLAATTSATGPVLATVQLATPTTTVLAYGATAGSINVTTSSANAPAGQTYTVKACTNAGMTTGCVTSAPILSGSDVGSLAYSVGSAGTAYYVTVTAVPSSGYLQSATSAVGGPHNDTSQIGTPGTPVVASSTTTAGAITATFTASPGVAPTSYTATACTNAAMTQNCVTQASYTSGAQLTGLTPGSSYWAQVAAVPPVGFIAATSAVSASSALASTQLTAPTGVSLAYGTVAGSIAVTYTGSSNAPGGQTYTVTACTNAGMTTGCVSNGNLASGANLTGLAYVQGAPGTAYYVTVTANASTGYAVSPPSAVAGPQNATSQIGVPGTPVTASSTTTAGAITATFTASAGTAPASYTAKACTNAAMTTGCVTQASYASGAQLAGLTPGTSYFVTVTAVPPAGYVSATSAVSASAAATTQLATPTINSVTPSATTAGALTISFSGSANAPGGQTYTATACTNAGMTTGCVTQANYTSNAQLTGLTAGSSYWVTITAVASSGYLAATTGSVGPTLATIQLAAPTGVSLAYGTVAGSIAVTYTGSSNAPGGQTYTVKACTNAGMTTGCVTNANLASGANLTGLAYAQGASGTAYYVTVTANASSGYLVSAPSSTAGPQNATSQVGAPGTPTVASSLTTAGAITATFTASAGVAPASYTATACTNAAMTTGCVTQASYASGTQLTGLTPGTSYYVTITAVPPAGFVSATSAVSASSAPATTQLAAPTGVSLAYGTVAGSIAVSYTGSSNAAGGQTYTVTACTNAGMTTGCVSNANLASGANLTGLAYVQGSAGTAYYVTVTANGSSGYLVSAPSSTAGPQNATSQVNAPGTPVTASSTTTAGAITATFSASTGVAPASYTATACTNAAMTAGCVAQANYASGAQLTGLVQGTSYYVTITAVPPAGYVSATSAVSASAAAATTQLATPSTPVLAYGPIAGSLTVTSTSSNAPGGETYTVKACTNAGMTTGCVTNASFTSGSTLSGLAYTQGSVGTSYYVTATANPVSGYVGSATSSVGGPQADTSQVNAPGTPTGAPSTTTAGAITSTFTASSGVAPASYTATVCTNAAMTTGCVTQTSYTSGAQLTGLTQGTSYYVEIIAVPPAGFVSATSAVSASATPATTQLAAATITSVSPSSTTAGQLTINFTGAANAPGGQSYTATACTNAAMTTGCVTQASYASGTPVTGLTPGTNYWATITAVASSGYLASTSSAFGPTLATVQLATPTINSVAPSATTAGALTITYTGSANAPGGQSYTATACTNVGMTTGCVTQTNYASGAQLTGLSAGTNYYVTLTAVASSGYLPVTTSAVGPTLATIQLNAPTAVSLALGTVAGSVAVTFTGSSNAPGGQSYTATACTNAGMTTGCVTGAITSGGNLTGLAYTQGSAGTAYYVTVTASASSGYLASSPSSVAGPQAEMSQVNAPTGLATAPSTTTAGAITATFTASTGTAPTSYTALACTNAAMTTGCVTKTSYVSGTQLTGLTAGTNYYVTITAVPPAGYVSATTAVSSATLATVQLTSPTAVSLAYGTVAGSIAVTFTGSSNAPGGQLYTATACTNLAMTTGCVSGSITSGGNLTGLAYAQGAAGTSYYVTVTAAASSGYLVSAASSVAGPQAATSQLNAPTGLATAPSTTTAGAITATFTASTGVAPASYTAIACTNPGMTTGCVTKTSYVSGAQLTGLTAGTNYYVTITAVPPAGYVSATTAVSAATLATVQLTAPSSVALNYGSVAGSVAITFTAPGNAPGGQVYTATACTNAAMTTGCVSGAITSGANLAGLAYTVGSAGTNYWATVTATASSGYLVSPASTVAGPHADTSQLSPPTSVTASTGNAHGRLNVSFTASTGTAPASYTAIACTNAAMTTGCVTVTNFSSGGTVTGLVSGTTYYAEITAVAPSTAYLQATSSPPSSAPAS